VFGFFVYGVLLVPERKRGTFIVFVFILSSAVGVGVVISSMTKTKVPWAVRIKHETSAHSFAVDNKFKKVHLVFIICAQYMNCQVFDG
jgi:hypothetical protein